MRMLAKIRFIDFFEFMRTSIHTNYIEVDECLLVNYRCWETGSDKVWFKECHLVFILSGEKKWEFSGEIYEARQGDVVFVKQGSGVVHHSSSSEFCALIIFIPHQYISRFIINNNVSKRGSGEEVNASPLIKLDNSLVLESYGNSILTYLAEPQIDAQSLAQVKLIELLHYIFSSQKLQGVASYLVSSTQDERYHLQSIMEGNYMQSLRLEDYAEMSNMSLSTFKRKFKEVYNVSPGTWLMERRLELARKLLTSTHMTVHEVSEASGFNSTSYFVKTFKKIFKHTPLQFRKEDA